MWRLCVLGIAILVGSLVGEITVSTAQASPTEFGEFRFDAAVPPSNDLLGTASPFERWAQTVPSPELAPLDPAAEAPRTLTDKAVEAAQHVERSFEAQLLGSSILVGVARTFPDIILHEPGNPGTSIETYKGPGLYAPAFGYSSASASGDKYLGGQIGKLHILWTLSFQANYAQFNADSQTQQTIVGGETGGSVRGNLLYGVALIAHNYTYDGEWAKWGARIGLGLGAGVAQFDGKLDYSVNGQNYSDTFSHGYDQLLLTQLALIEVRFSHILIGAQRLMLDGADVTMKASGAHYGVEINLWTYQAGYLFYF